MILSRSSAVPVISSDHAPATPDTRARALALLLLLACLAPLLLLAAPFAPAAHAAPPVVVEIDD